ncbi:MAG: hypothetical protein ACLQVI_25870 [Polyangiaceae bacterium]
MVVSKRFFSWSDVVIRRWLVRHPSFLVKIVQTRGVCSDDVRWEKPRLWAVVPEWPCAAIPTRGHGLMRDGRTSVEMQRGYIGYVERGGDFRARTEPADAFGVFLQWDPAVFGKAGGPSMSRTPLAAADLARIDRTLARIVTGAPGLEGDAVDLFAVIGSLGMLSDRPALGDLVLPPSPRVARVGEAIDGVLSRSGVRPMVVDLMRALDCSERQARYLVGEYVEAYALQGAREWRTLVNVWTTYLAGLLMTAKGATTEGVAGLLGYGSPNALCHALTNAGLPSPGEMRRIVAQLT